MPGKPNNASSILKWLPLVLVIVAGAAAWGQQKAKTDGHDRRIQQNEKVVRELEKSQATILERTRQTREIGDENKQMLKEVLRELRRK